jgi:hypothetical protein
MLHVLWRVEALALPALSLRCARCARAARFVCTERFRVNANGNRLDVWLLYRCADCGESHKQRVERRAPASALPAGLLAAYQADSPALVRRCAFAAGGGAEVPARVVRDALPASGALRARIDQPEPCGLRWQRLLALELCASRARLARAAEGGALRVNGGCELGRVVRDGDQLELAWPLGA